MPLLDGTEAEEVTWCPHDVSDALRDSVNGDGSTGADVVGGVGLEACGSGCQNRVDDVVDKGEVPNLFGGRQVCMIEIP